MAADLDLCVGQIRNGRDFGGGTANDKVAGFWLPSGYECLDDEQRQYHLETSIRGEFQRYLMQISHTATIWSLNY